MDEWDGNNGDNWRVSGCPASQKAFKNQWDLRLIQSLATGTEWRILDSFLGFLLSSERSKTLPSLALALCSTIQRQQTMQQQGDVEIV